MKNIKRSILTIVLTLILTITSFAQATLTLIWIEPPGYQSTLYSSTNLNGSWSSLGEVNPPYLTQPTNQVTFFYVVVMPTNTVNHAVIYLTNPNTENVKPANTNAPALAYSDDGAFPLWVWSIIDQMWK